MGFALGLHRYFSKVVLSALPVGHSHSDYDREGAALIHFTKREPGEGSLSPADLLRKLEAMPSACGRGVLGAYDFQEWLEEHIDPRLQHHTKALKWEFALRPRDGKCVASYAGGCSGEATVVEFGPILQSSPAAPGPSTCKRWRGSAAAQHEWGVEVAKNRGRCRFRPNDDLIPPAWLVSSPLPTQKYLTTQVGRVVPFSPGGFRHH